MGASPPAAVVDLVERFERDRRVFLSPDYKEEQLRAEFGQRTCRLRFLNPLSPRLGGIRTTPLTRLVKETGEVSLFSRACAKEVNGLRRGRGLESRRQTSILRSLLDRLHERGITLCRLGWTEGEERIVDRFAHAVLTGKYPSQTAAATECVKEIRDYYARLRGVDESQLGPYAGRPYEGTKTRIAKRLRELGFRGPVRQCWDAAEWRVVARWCNLYVLFRARRKRGSLTEAVNGLRDDLAGRGYSRTFYACKIAILHYHEHVTIGRSSRAPRPPEEPATTDK